MSQSVSKYVQAITEKYTQNTDKLVKCRINNAPFDKSYSGIISDILFEPDTPIDSPQFGTYKIRFGTSEKTVKLNDDFVHEIGERVNVCMFENNPNHIKVEPVIKHLAPNSIDYDIKENKYVEHRIVKTNGKTYETTGEYKIIAKENDDGSREVTEMKLPDGQTIKFEGFESWNK